MINNRARITRLEKALKARKQRVHAVDTRPVLLIAEVLQVSPGHPDYDTFINKHPHFAGINISVRKHNTEQLLQMAGVTHKPAVIAIFPHNGR